MIGNNIEYIQANTEIKCLLKYFPINYINKLPTKLLEMKKLLDAGAITQEDYDKIKAQLLGL